MADNNDPCPRVRLEQIAPSVNPTGLSAKDLARSSRPLAERRFSGRANDGHAVRWGQTFAWTAEQAVERTCRREIPDTG